MGAIKVRKEIVLIVLLFFGIFLRIRSPEPNLLVNNLSAYQYGRALDAGLELNDKNDWPPGMPLIIKSMSPVLPIEKAALLFPIFIFAFSILLFYEIDLKNCHWISFVFALMPISVTITGLGVLRPDILFSFLLLLAYAVRKRRDLLFLVALVCFYTWQGSPLFFIFFLNEAPVVFAALLFSHLFRLNDFSVLDFIFDTISNKEGVAYISSTRNQLEKFSFGKILLGLNPFLLMLSFMEAKEEKGFFSLWLITVLILSLYGVRYGLLAIYPVSVLSGRALGRIYRRFFIKNID
jgi:asparagine N-glycosylation enzyme membrane subunit Stt3